MDEPRGRRRNGALRETPVRLRERIARGARVGLGGADLVAARRQLRRGHRCLQCPTCASSRFSCVRASSSAAVLTKPLACSCCCRRRFAAESSRAAIACRSCSATVSTSHRSLAGPEVREPGLGRLQLLLGLPARRDFVLLLQREHRRARRDGVATFHVSLGERAGERRSDAHVLAFDVAVQRPVRRRSAAGREQRRGRERAQRAESRRLGHGVRCRSRVDRGLRPPDVPATRSRTIASAPGTSRSRVSTSRCSRTARCYATVTGLPAVASVSAART